MEKKPNEGIRCTVEQCRHNCCDSHHCSLSSITVGTHEKNPSMDQCTDCLSFVKK